MKILLIFVMFQLYGSVTPGLQQTADLIQEIINNDEFASMHIVQVSDTVHRLVYQDHSCQIIDSIFDALIGQPSVQDLSIIHEMLNMLSQHHIVLTSFENVDHLGDYLAQGFLTVPQLPDFDFIVYPGEEGRLLLRLKDYLNSCENLLLDIYLELQGLSTLTGNETDLTDPIVKLHRMLEHTQTQESKKHCEIFFGNNSFILFTASMCDHLSQLLLQICQHAPQTDFKQLFSIIKSRNIIFRTANPQEYEYFIFDCRLEVSCLEQELARVSDVLYQDYIYQRPASIDERTVSYGSALYTVLTTIADYCQEMQQKTLDILNTVKSDSLGLRQYSSEEILAR